MIRSGIEDGSITFTAGADVDAEVLPKYASAFDKWAACTELCYDNLGWGDEELEQLADAFDAAFERSGKPLPLLSVDLSDNQYVTEATKRRLQKLRDADGALANVETMIWRGCPVLKERPPSPTLR